MTKVVLAVVAGGIVVVGAAYAVSLVLPQEANPAGTVMAGIATVVLACLTAPLLVLNSRMIGETRNAAEATQRAADATEKDVEASNENNRLLQTQLQREWRPVLVIGDLANVTPFDDPNGDYTVSISNLGRGPALNCIVVVATKEQWRRSPPFNLPAGFMAAQYKLAIQQGEPPQGLTWYTGSDHGRHIVVFCEDSVGSYLRFSPPSGGPDEWHEYAKAPIWLKPYHGLIPGRLGLVIGQEGVAHLAELFRPDLL